MFRTERRRSPKTGQAYPWILGRSAMVNKLYYICAVDLDFGLFFLKFCSYLLFNAKLCLNGPEYAQRQLARELSPSRPSTMAMTSGLAGGCTTCRGCARSALRRTGGAFQAINGPLAAGRQHISGPRFDPRVHLLSHALVCSGTSHKASASPCSSHELSTVSCAPAWQTRSPCGTF